MHNSTVIDDMPIIQGHFSEDLYIPDETNYEKVFLDVFTFVGLTSFIANILLCFVIIKYDQLRKDATNKIFLHVNIFQAIYLVATPMTIRIGMFTSCYNSVHYFMVCFSYQIEANLAFGIVWMIFMLLTDWYIRVYYKDTHVKFSKNYKFFLIALYVFIALSSSITSQVCFRHKTMYFAYLNHSSFFYLIMLYVVGFLVFVLFVVNIVHAIRKRTLVVNHRSGNFGLAIANICFLFWVPALIYFLVCMLGFIFGSPTLSIVVLGISHLSPVFNLIYLYNYDNNYDVFLKQIFRCNCSENKNESLEYRSVVYNDSNGVQIPNNV